MPHMEWLGLTLGKPDGLPAWIRVLLGVAAAFLIMTIVVIVVS